MSLRQGIDLTIMIINRHTQGHIYDIDCLSHIASHNKPLIQLCTQKIFLTESAHSQNTQNPTLFIMAVNV